MGSGNGLIAPYTATRTMFNGEISPRRRISTQTLDLARVKALAESTGGTLNDVVALVLGTALRQYLIELDSLPEQPLVAGVLTSLHTAMEAEPGSSAGNVIGLIFADLATETADVAERAQRVHSSTVAGKAHLLGMKKNAMAYTTLMMAPMLAAMALGQAHRIPPIHNVGLSNVPGTDAPLYYNGAEVEALHATTIIASGQALIVAVTSWNGRLTFTLTACPDAVPSSERIATLLVDALAEVEKAVPL
jgi:WS/DGAT/MGAT family acyltransferase